MHQVCGSESTKTGIILLYIAARAQEIIVMEGIIISEPTGRFRDLTARMSAFVPLFTVIACLTPRKLANASSNFLIYIPSEEIHPVFKASVTYSKSFSIIRGSLTGIIFLLQ